MSVLLIYPMYSGRFSAATGYLSRKKVYSTVRRRSLPSNQGTLRSIRPNKTDLEYSPNATTLLQVYIYIFFFSPPTKTKSDCVGCVFHRRMRRRSPCLRKQRKQIYSWWLKTIHRGRESKTWLLSSILRHCLPRWTQHDMSGEQLRRLGLNQLYHRTHSRIRNVIRYISGLVWPQTMAEETTSDTYTDDSLAHKISPLGS